MCLSLIIVFGFLGVKYFFLVCDLCFNKKFKEIVVMCIIVAAHNTDNVVFWLKYYPQLDKLSCFRRSDAALYVWHASGKRS